MQCSATVMRNGEQVKCLGQMGHLGPHMMPKAGAAVVSKTTEAPPPSGVTNEHVLAEVRALRADLDALGRGLEKLIEMRVRDRVAEVVGQQAESPA